MKEPDLDALMDCAEKNDIQTATKIIRENLSCITYSPTTPDDEYFPVYELAYHLNHREFCYNLIKEFSDETGVEFYGQIVDSCISIEI